MSDIANDLASFKSLLKLSVEFLNGRESLRDLKINQKKTSYWNRFSSN